MEEDDAFIMPCHKDANVSGSSQYSRAASNSLSVLARPAWVVNLTFLTRSYVSVRSLRTLRKRFWTSYFGKPITAGVVKRPLIVCILEQQQMDMNYVYIFKLDIPS